MTVHQSKGLQFDIVVLPQLDRTFSVCNKSLVAARSDPTQPIDRVMPWIKQEWRSYLPEWIEQLHSQHMSEQLGEELCVLYVALTRAIYSLQMIVAPSISQGAANGTKNGRKSEKNLPQSLAGLIRAALTDGRPLPASTKVFEYGDPHWFERLATDEGQVNRPRPAAPCRVTLRSSGAPSRAGAERAVRPSQLEGGARVDLKRQLSLTAQAAMERGTLIHAFFEQVEWLDEAIPTSAQLVALGCSLEADAALRDAAIADFLRMLDGRSVREVLSRNYYQPWRTRYGAGAGSSLRLEVRREQPLTVRDGNDWLSGTIDRLVVLYQHDRPVAADILDFKTDSVPTADLREDRIEFYRPQLRAYRRGVSGMLRLDVNRISTRLLFVGEGHVVELTRLGGSRGMGIPPAGLE
jgi:ATP-dependent exoDNAse (exonuclease V) beta subunit